MREHGAEKATMPMRGAIAAVAILVGGSPYAVGQDPNRLTLDLGGVTMQLVRIPAGTFLMGSPSTVQRAPDNERPQHEVTIADAFYLGAHEVTRKQFAAFVADAAYRTDAERNGWAFAWDGKKWDKVKGASWRKVGFEQGDDHAVVCVSWTDAQAFCEWLGKRTGRTVWLPTEAQWEYACRAGSTTHWSWGDDPAGGKGKCNVADKTAKARFRGWRIFPWADGYVFTAPVGTYQPNAFGLYDMHGNVWEWCRDWYRESYASAGRAGTKGRYDDGSGAPRVVRGGSWMSTPGRCRSASRAACEPLGSVCDFIVGFRVSVDAARDSKARGADPATTRPVPR